MIIPSVLFNIYLKEDPMEMCNLDSLSTKKFFDFMPKHFPSVSKKPFNNVIDYNRKSMLDGMVIENKPKKPCTTDIALLNKVFALRNIVFWVNERSVVKCVEFALLQAAICIMKPQNTIHEFATYVAECMLD